MHDVKTLSLTAPQKITGEIRNPVRGSSINIFISYTSNASNLKNEVVEQSWPNDVSSCSPEVGYPKALNKSSSSFVALSVDETTLRNLCPLCNPQSSNQSNTLSSEIFNGIQPIYLNDACVVQSPPVLSSAELSPSLKFRIGPLRIQGCHFTQYETANGYCVCKAGFKRSTQKLHDSTVCIPCSNNEFRPAERADNPDPAISFQDTVCIPCPANMEIKQESDRSAFANCRCISRDKNSDGYYFAYNTNPNTLKRGQCPYKELSLFKYGEWKNRQPQPLCECRTCKEYARCDNGTLVPNEGYWLLTVDDVQKEKSWENYNEHKKELERDQLDKLIRADTLIKCSNLVACSGGKCNAEKGYSGYLCKICKEGWGKSAGDQCAECPKPAWIATFLAF